MEKFVADNNIQDFEQFSAIERPWSGIRPTSGAAAALSRCIFSPKPLELWRQVDEEGFRLLLHRAQTLSRDHRRPIPHPLEDSAFDP